MAKQAEPKPVNEATVLVEIPLTPALRAGYVKCNIEVEVRGKRGETLKRITDALVDSGAALDGGQLVRTPADAFRWLLDQAGKTNE
jgi:hypothetical protein